MVFYSASFLVFFVLFFLFYWLVFNKTIKVQNAFLLFGSYVFYGLWNWRFLFLLIGSSILSYALALLLGKATQLWRRRAILAFGITAALLPLLLFKYLDFFCKTLATLTGNMRLDTLGLILPLGISFYSFRLISYLLDVDRGKLEPVREGLIFFNYVAFFPSIISGPIDRLTLLGPQLKSPRVFEYHLAADGMRQILWGLFKKLVIADNCAIIVNNAFEFYPNLPAVNLLVSGLLYSIQIYADFSGYSDMAIGIAKLLGFKITRNFNNPFFAENIAEFWRRWHMSLTSWTTEYIFTPLTIAFRNWGKVGLALALILNFFIIGLWHGANWTFVVFGLVHAIYYIPLILKGKLNSRQKRSSTSNKPSGPELIRMAGVFLLISFAFIFFRANSIVEALNYLKALATNQWLTWPNFPNSSHLGLVFFFTLLMLVMEWIQRKKEHALQLRPNEKLSSPGFTGFLRWTIYILLMLSVFGFQTNQQDFIYFRF